MVRQKDINALSAVYAAQEAAACAGDPCALYRWRQDHMRSHGFQEIAATDFYRDLFPVGSFERQGRQDDCRPNGIITRILKTGDKRGRGSHRLITDDLDALHNPAAAFGSDASADSEASPIYICSPIGYSGLRPTNKGAYKAYALTLDIDGNGLLEHSALVHQACINRNLPTPTYIVSSGNGLHLYYLFAEPVPLYPEAAKVLSELKYRLIRRMWNGDTSKEMRQYQGIVQGYRVVGQPSKLGADYPVRAWRTGERVTLEYLNEHTRYFGGDAFTRVDTPVITDFSVFNPRDKRQSGKINAEENFHPWSVKRALYDWFFMQITRKAEAGHRYNCILSLAIYATKCRVTRAELESDAYSLLELFDGRSDDKHGRFTRQDIEDALKIYSKPEAHKHRRAWISSKCGFDIPARKRNGRKQAEHVRLMNFIRDEINQNTSWREGNGRPAGSSKQREAIECFRAEHPDASKADCIRATGFDKKTVYRWWNAAEPAVILPIGLPDVR